MSLFLIIRHGRCAPIGKYIAGRIKGIHLNEEGKTEVTRLADSLRNIPIEKVYCSPLERACETAQIICEMNNIHYEIRDELIEIDYGDWSGKTFSELTKDSLWKEYNLAKSVIHVPHGEMLIEIESRVVRLTEKLRRVHQGIVALVSHGEPIKCLIAHYTGIPLDFLKRMEIDTASVSVLQLDNHNAQLLCCNYTGSEIKYDCF